LNYLAIRSEARQARVPLRPPGWYGELAVVWRFSLPSLLSGVLATPVYWLCSTLLVNQPEGYAQMGIFNAANQWFIALLLLPTLLGQVALPLLSERLGQQDTLKSARILAVCIKLSALAAVPLVLLGSLASPYIMAWYGRGFAASWPTLIAVLLTGGLVAIQTPVGQIIAASGRMWLGGLMNLGWAVCFLLATWWLVRWGALGFATARLLAYIAHTIWTLAFASYLLKKTGQEPDPHATTG
jgi:O-antigen/teichoic acid export membrane protein